MAEPKHRSIETNGIKMHVVEQGAGPTVLMCHGWPESWYSWRHQIAALADAGFHAVAPDQRGYGQTDRPEPIEAYNILQLAGDIVGLVNEMGAEPMVIVGHDWGAPVAWYSALLRPDLFRAVALLSVPYLPRSSVRPSLALSAMAGDKNFYQLYFQEPGKVERELEEDPRRTMAMMLYSASGDPPENERWRFLFEKNERFIETGVMPKKLPSWLSEKDLDFFAGEFKRTGFRGGINWYRNIDRNWELTPFLDGARVLQPSIFIAGDVDPVIPMTGGPDGAYAALDVTMPNLRKKVLIPGAGHWIQQERPAEVNRLLLDFLKNL
jgi:pimeloyl-ACP methyl ester carboxylesterase